MGKVIAICNQKGGVGKTTTAFQLARAAVRSGQKVLLIDSDPQANLTSVATADSVGEDRLSLADVLSSRTTDGIQDVKVSGVWSALSVVPAVSQALGAVRDELVVAGPGRENRLREALDLVKDDYGLVLIDCPPSLDQLTINALVAADAVLVVTQAKLFSSNGLAQLLTTVDSVRSYYRPQLVIAGVIVNQFESTTVSAKTWLSELEAAAKPRGLQIFAPVPKRVLISDATEAARGLDEWGSGEATKLAEIYNDQLKLIESIVKI